MLRKLLLPTLLIALGYCLWASPELKAIAAGVAVFVFGMLSLEQGFRRFTGGALESLLRRSTRGLGRSIGFGILTTTLMQSSSLVSVLTISFLSAGLIGLGAGIGIIFGANLGTTTGAWLVAGFGLKVDIGAFAMPMLVFGVLLIFQKPKSLHAAGYVLTGLGFLFLGIHFMKEGFEAFKDSIDLSAYAVAGYPGVFLYVAMGLIATVVMQSSHATLVLTITALAAQQVSYENALALAIGSNLGTTISAIIGALAANIEGKRLALAHLIFNLVTGLIAIAIIQQMMLVVDGLSTRLGIAADDYTLKLALFHSLFNVLGLLLMAPLTGALVRLLVRLLPDRAEDLGKPMFLSAAVFELPNTAIEAMRKETIRLYDRAVEIIAHALAVDRDRLLSDVGLATLVSAARRPFPESIEQSYEQSIKSLYSAIVEFTSQMPSNATPQQLQHLHALRIAGRNVVEAVKAAKHLQSNLLVFMRSPNAAVREQYDQLRIQIGSVIRAIEALRRPRDETVTVLSLDHVRVQLEQADLVANGVLDRLIRERRISARVATSLMNDSSYAMHLCRNLIEMAQTLFAAQDLRIEEAERSVALSDEEIAKAAQRKSG